MLSYLWEIVGYPVICKTHMVSPQELKDHFRFAKHIAWNEDFQLSSTKVVVLRLTICWEVYNTNLTCYCLCITLLLSLCFHHLALFPLRGEDIRAVRGFGDSNLEERLGNDVNKRVWQPFFLGRNLQFNYTGLSVFVSF